MSKLQITVPDELHGVVAERAGQAGFDTAEEYVSAMVIADAVGPGTLSEDELENLLLDRVDQQSAGEMTAEVFEEIRRKIRDRVGPRK